MSNAPDIIALVSFFWALLGWVPFSDLINQSVRHNELADLTHKQKLRLFFVIPLYIGPIASLPVFAYYGLQRTVSRMAKFVAGGESKE